MMILWRELTKWEYCSTDTLKMHTGTVLNLTLLRPKRELPSKVPHRFKFAQLSSQVWPGLSRIHRQVRFSATKWILSVVCRSKNRILLQCKGITLTGTLSKTKVTTSSWMISTVKTHGSSETY